MRSADKSLQESEFARNRFCRCCFLIGTTAVAHEQDPYYSSSLLTRPGQARSYLGRMQFEMLRHITAYWKAHIALCPEQAKEQPCNIQGISSLWVPLFVAQSDFRPLIAKPGTTGPPTYETV
jgi:hypothetical protein